MLASLLINLVSVGLFGSGKLGNKSTVSIYKQVIENIRVCGGNKDYVEFIMCSAKEKLSYETYI